MRVLVLSDLWPPFPGGAERLIFNLSRALHQAGCDVYVLTGYGPAQEYDGPRVHVADIGVLADREAGLQMVLDVVAQVQPDVILTHHLYASQFGAELVATGIPVVHVVLNGARMAGCAFAVYITEWVRRKYEGLATDLLVLPPAYDDVVADTHGPAVGFIKPLTHKGVDLVYGVAERLPGVPFVVLRGEWQGIEVIRTDLPNVTFMEPVVHMAEFYRRVRIMLAPSRSEDAGTIAQEATVNGLPCVSSWVDGLAETNGGGIQLAPDDVPAWTDTVVRLLTDSDLYDGVVSSQRRHLAASADQVHNFVANILALGT